MRTLFLPLLCAALLVAPPAALHSSVSVHEALSVKDFGAVGDGLAMNTRAIQAAIDEAHASGGGTVYFPPGDYLSGTLFLRSGVTLYLDTGATLLGSTDNGDFPRIRPKMRSYTDKYVSQSLLYAEDQEHIGLAGNGTIDGQGEHYQWKEYGDRPNVIRFVNCRHVHVEGIHLRSSPLWMQHYLGCEHVTVRGIHVYNHSTWNNDMIDIDCCRNVLISDCWGNSDDDALTLKSTSDRPTENVTITNCVLGSGCNAIKMGTESNGGFRNISITNCVIDSWYGEKGFYGLPIGISGVALEIVDGGTLENITVSNIDIKNVMSPLFLRFANRARKFKDDMEKPGIGAYRNVVISNINAREVGDIGCSITGLPQKSMEGITISNVRMSFPGGGTREDYERDVPELEQDYPEAFMFGKLPAYGFYCRHVEGLRLENIDLVLEGADYRPPMVFEDVANLDLDGFTERRPGASRVPAIVLRNVRDAGITGCRPLNETPALLLLEGSGSSGISAVGNHLDRAARLAEAADGADAEQIFSAANRMGR